MYPLFYTTGTFQPIRTNDSTPFHLHTLILLSLQSTGFKSFQALNIVFFVRRLDLRDHVLFDEFCHFTAIKWKAMLPRWVVWELGVVPRFLDTGKLGRKTWNWQTSICSKFCCCRGSQVNNRCVFCRHGKDPLTHKKPQELPMKDMAEVFRNTEAAWITVGFWSFGYIADGVFFSLQDADGQSYDLYMDLEPHEVSHDGQEHKDIRFCCFFLFFFCRLGIKLYCWPAYAGDDCHVHHVQCSPCPPCSSCSSCSSSSSSSSSSEHLYCQGAEIRRTSQKDPTCLDTEIRSTLFHYCIFTYIKYFLVKSLNNHSAANFYPCCDRTTTFSMRVKVPPFAA